MESFAAAFAKRLFTRAALFGWTIPFLLALSRAEASSAPDFFKDSASALAATAFDNVLMRLRTVRFCAVRVAVLRMSFLDDLLLAMIYVLKKVFE